jgi:2-hydroxy-3-keto-5-methylthiopentenyl-1-phosphate phosphatase
MEYRAIISSDWNECLAPSGPFDPIAFAYPELKPDLSAIFTKYTSNEIPLSQAIASISRLSPSPLTVEQMDNYLDKSFSIYVGVTEFIEWAKSRDILFMINTTGMQGFFQRAIAKKLIPEVPLVAANPLINYTENLDGDCYRFTVEETLDKPKNTQAAVSSFSIPSDKIVVIGDSGGDGPHFEWGDSVGALLIGSMTKASLSKYCEDRRVQIDQRFGVNYSQEQPRILQEEMKFNFMDLTSVIDKFLSSS